MHDTTGQWRADRLMESHKGNKGPRSHEKRGDQVSSAKQTGEVVENMVVEEN